MPRATYAKRTTVAHLDELIERLGCAHAQVSFLINPNGGRLAHSASHITNDDIAVAQQEIVRAARTITQVRLALKDLLP